MLMNKKTKNMKRAPFECFSNDCGLITGSNKFSFSSQQRTKQSYRIPFGAHQQYVGFVCFKPFPMIVFDVSNYVIANSTHDFNLISTMTVSRLILVDVMCDVHQILVTSR
uniref:Uncharacterized protein n=1 Tax=Anopheles albimanus TaxID=7167 RepID=A0A182FYX2_ANOAL